MQVCDYITRATPERKGLGVFWERLWHRQSERKSNIPQKPHEFKDLLSLNTKNSCIKNPLRFSPAPELNKTSDHINQPQGSLSPWGEGSGVCQMLRLSTRSCFNSRLLGVMQGLGTDPRVLRTRAVAAAYRQAMQLLQSDTS